jgi:glycosyltransferase involved in cell wall biosynthesis
MANLSAQRMCVVISSLRGGGAERLVVDVCNQWVNKGITVDILVSEPNKTFYKIDARIRVIVFESDSRLGTFLCTLKLLALVARGDYNGVWLHLWPTSLLSIPLRLILLKRSYICITEHNNLYKTTLRPASGLSILMHIFVCIAYLCADKVVAVSNGLSSQVASLVPFKKQSVVCIYNSVIGRLEQDSTTQLFRAPHQWTSSSFKILAVGSLKEQKGYKYLLHAVSLLELQVHLVILGSGPLLLDLQHLCAAYDISDRVTFVASNQRVSPWFQLADLFVSSSLWEGYGTAIAEAVSFNLPIVATDCDYGPSEILSDYEHSILVPPADSLSLSSAILSFAIDKRRPASSNHSLHLNSCLEVALKYADVFGLDLL